MGKGNNMGMFRRFLNLDRCENRVNQIKAESANDLNGVTRKMRKMNKIMEKTIAYDISILIGIFGSVK